MVESEEELMRFSRLDPAAFGLIFECDRIFHVFEVEYCPYAYGICVQIRDVRQDGTVFRFPRITETETAVLPGKGCFCPVSLESAKACLVTVFKIFAVDRYFNRCLRIEGPLSQSVRSIFYIP